MTRLRIAACAIVALSTCAAIWALLLAGGVKAFPADSFLADPIRLARQSHVTFVLAGIAGASAAAVAAATPWSRPRLALSGLAIALCGAALLLLSIGADLLSSADLDRDIYPQPMFWYHVVGILGYMAFGCFVIGWGLWLGALLTAWLRRRSGRLS